MDRDRFNSENEHGATSIFIFYFQLLTETNRTLFDDDNFEVSTIKKNEDLVDDIYWLLLSLNKLKPLKKRETGS